ncbi:MAG TPA: PEP-CTERM sorting domain-containing protein [Isosphaeraceae bacterium]|jgi:hypothetical protein
MNVRCIRYFGAGLLALALAPGAWGDVTIGNVNSGEGNNFPFGGAYQDSFAANRYQQVYSGALVGGPTEITFVSFYASASGQNANGTYTLSLSTTSAAVNGLDSNMANNVGPNVDTFFSGTLPAYPAAVGNRLTFTLATPFLFDPGAGNLLLDVQISGVTNNSSAPYVAQDGDFGTQSSRMVNGNATSTSSWGLVTTFGTAAVPEPGSLGLCLFGVATAGGMAWRRRRA